MRRPLAVFITLCLASTLDAAPAPRKEALVKQAVLLTDPQDMRMTEAMFRAYEEQFTEQELERLLAFLKGDVGRKFLGVLKEEKKWLMTRAMADPAAELQKSKENATRASIRAIAAALITRSIDVKKYPTVSTIGELAAVLEPRYIPRTPRHDGWGGEFQYIAAADGSSYRIISGGPDGRIASVNRTLKATVGVSDDIVFQDGEFLHPNTP